MNKIEKIIDKPKLHELCLNDEKYYFHGGFIERKKAILEFEIKKVILETKKLLENKIEEINKGIEQIDFNYKKLNKIIKGAEL